MNPNTANSEIAYDVAIVGAGVAGSTLALALQQNKIDSVVLISRPDEVRPRVGESVSPAIAGILRSLGLDPSLDKLGHRPCHGNLSAWGSSGVVSDDFLSRGRGHGWQLDRSSFDAWLQKTTLERGTEAIMPAVIRSVERAANEWRLTVKGKGKLSDETYQIRTPIIVDASGRYAALVHYLNISKRCIDSMVGLAAFVVSAEPSSLRGRTFIEAVRYGWWYAACLPDNRVVVILMTDSDIARSHRFREWDYFRTAWCDTEHLRHMIPPPHHATQISSYHCASQYSEQVVGLGWLAVGDAMIGLDPLTGSGIVVAMEGALAAADVIAKWQTGDATVARDVATEYSERANNLLRRYLTERKIYYGRETRWATQPFWHRRIRS